MVTSKQEQQQNLVKSTNASEEYEWSYIRVAEHVTINVVSAAIIGTGAILGGAVYAGWTLLLNVLHAPSGLIGILAFVLLGAVLMLLILVVVIVAWIRGIKSATLAGMLLGAVIGAAIGSAIDSGKKWNWNFEWPKTATNGQASAQEHKQKTATKTEGE